MKETNEPELEIRSGSRGGQQVRIVDGKHWTEAIRGTFLDQLALSANVRASAQAVNMSFQGAYKLRRRDADFARGWDVALREGYAMLELEMLHRARFGSTRTITERSDTALVCETMVHDYPDGLAMRLLALHQARIDAAAALPSPPAPGEGKVLKLDYLTTVLDAMRDRLPDAKDADDRMGGQAGRPASGA